MLTEPLPIDIFIAVRFEDRKIMKVIESWPIEADALRKIVSQHFKDMGIFHAAGTLDAHLTETIIKILKNSPVIADLLHKAQLADVARRQSRHAQVGGS